MEEPPGGQLAGWVSPEEAPELPSFALVLSQVPCGLTHTWKQWSNGAALREPVLELSCLQPLPAAQLVTGRVSTSPRGYSGVRT